MSEWQDKTLEELFPSELAAIIDALDTATGLIVTALTAIAAALDAVSQFLVDVADPAAAAIAALRLLIDTMANDLENTGLYQIVVMPEVGPETFASLKGFAGGIGESIISTEFTYQQFIGRIVGALDDTSDPHRPNFSEFANVTGVVVMVGAPSLADLVAILKKLWEVFGIQDFLNLWNAYDFFPPDRTERFGSGVSPDFTNIRAVDLIPPLASVVDLLRKIVYMLDTALGFLALVKAFAAMLSAKADQLLAIAATIQEIVDLIQTLLDDTGIYVLVIPPGVGGNERLKSELLNSGDPPPFGSGSWVGGIAWFGGAGAGPALEFIFG